jgi:anti-anti-sigma factor
MEPTLKINLKETSAGQNYQVVEFHGDFDKAGHTDVRPELDKIVKEFVLADLIFDFADLKFINSESIGYLMEIHAHLVKIGKALKIVGANEHVKEVLQTIGIAEVIPMYNDLNSYLNK